jgi:hypothetical protein
VSAPASSSERLTEKERGARIDQWLETAQVAQLTVEDRM